MAVIVLVWLYYSCWVILAPMFEHSYFDAIFPERKFAILVPVLLGTVFLTFVCVQTGLIFIDKKLE
jgi:Dolichol phosphate-mannose biosynthesis regulatory protein (DPM2)